MLKFENVEFAYPGAKKTIDNLTFHIPKGDFVALIGTNGAGKSTISRLSNGLLHPDKGHVFIDGADTLTTRTSAIAKKVGFLFQNPDRQICQNTVWDEVAFGLRIQGVPEDEVKRRTEAALERFKLSGDWFPFTRSRGERQRIALASVLVCEPEMVILDEPTTGLDYRECISIMDYVTELNLKEGLTVLMVSHDMELVQEYAKHVFVLTGGRLVGEGKTNDIMKNMSILKKAHVLPAQIPQLALRFGDRFSDVYTIEEMRRAVLAELGSEAKSVFNSDDEGLLKKELTSDDEGLLKKELTSDDEGLLKKESASDGEEFIKKKLNTAEGGNA
jgi:energy-coupling factor transport system ATP-binding protein